MLIVSAFKLFEINFVFLSFTTIPLAVHSLLHFIGSSNKVILEHTLQSLCIHATVALGHKSSFMERTFTMLWLLLLILQYRIAACLR